MTIVRAIAISLALLPVNFFTASAYTSMGYGLQTCGWWTAQRNEPAPAIQAGYAQSWILGFLTGNADITATLKMALPKAVGMPLDPLSGVDDLAVFAWIDNECHKHPLQNLLKTSEAFMAAHPR